MIIYKNNQKLIEILKKLKSYCYSKNIILHSDVFRLGFFKTKLSYNENLELIHDLILDVFHDFQIIVPTFNYDFLQSKIYDVKKDKSQVGALNEFFRKKYILNRTYTPVFNVVTTKKTSQIKKKSCKNPHGKMSFYNTAYQNNYDIIFLGKFIPSMAHYVERRVNVPYRYKKKFSGKIKNYKGNTFPTAIEYNVRPLFNKTILMDTNKIINDLKKNKILKYVNSRTSFLGCYNSKIVSDFWIKKNLRNKMYFLTKNSKLNAKYLLKKYGTPLKFKKIEKN